MRTLLKIFVLILVVVFFKRYMETGSIAGQKLELPLEVEAISGSPAQPGKPTIVEFWATWCGPCRQTIPHLNSIYSTYGPRGLQIVGLTDESAATVAAFQRNVPMHYPVAQDTSRQYFKRFGIRGIPSMVLLDANGAVVWKGHPGEFNPQEHLEKLLKSRS